ncbi:MAG: hypothetical protein NUW37_15760 [Planctomycetes bacterium]|nr:hypothetical protein [Planctomycetota bacterium]
MNPKRAKDTRHVTQVNPEVLIVGGDPENQGLCEDVSASIGLMACSVDNGSTGFHSASRVNLKVVICALSTVTASEEIWNGGEFIRGIEISMPDLPVILLLDPDEPEDKELSSLQNVKFVLRKPVVADALRSALETLLQR